MCLAWVIPVMCTEALHCLDQAHILPMKAVRDYGLIQATTLRYPLQVQEPQTDVTGQTVCRGHYSCEAVLHITQAIQVCYLVFVGSSLAPLVKPLEARLSIQACRLGWIEQRLK